MCLLCTCYIPCSLFPSLFPGVFVLVSRTIVSYLSADVAYAGTFKMPNLYH